MRSTVAQISGDRMDIPKEITKSKRDHWVHLTACAKAQLEAEVAPRFFTEHSVSQVQRRVRELQEGKADRWTPHDLRRTFATRLGDLGIGPHVIEKCLDHIAQGVAAIYNRAELEGERIAATKLWAAELANILAAKQ